MTKPFLVLIAGLFFSAFLASCLPGSAYASAGLPENCEARGGSDPVEDNPAPWNPPPPPPEK